MSASCKCGQIDTTEVLVFVLEISRDGYHRGIVCGVAEFGYIYSPPESPSMIVEGIAQSVVCRHSASYSHMGDACQLDCLTELLHEDVDNGILKTCRQVLLVVLNEIGLLGNPFPEIIEEGGLQSGEAIVKSRYMWF